MDFITTEQQQPLRDTWYLVKCPDYSESGFEIAKFEDGEWQHGHFSQSCHEYVESYSPTPLEEF